MNDKPAKKTETIEVRISHEKKQDFMAACRDRGSSASAVIRNFIDAYVMDADRAPHPNLIKEFTMVRFIQSTRGRLAALVGCLAIGAVMATPSVAADPRVEAVFQWWDADHDGGVSLEEFMDEAKNNDSAPPPGSAFEIGMTTKEVPSPDEPRDAMFRRLDSNHDGVLSLAELDRQVTIETTADSADAILIADLNGNGAVTAAEIAGYMTEQWSTAGAGDPAILATLMAEAMVAVHDQDGDGDIEPVEFEASRR